MRRVTSVGLLVVALGLFRAGRAEAEVGEGLAVLAYTIVAMEVAATVGGVVPIIGNGASISRHDRPGVGWIITGFVIGGIEAATGGLILARDHRSDWGLGFGLANATMGVLNIGLASWAVAKRTRNREAEARSTRLALVPVLASDSSGGVGYGLGLRVAGW